MIALFFFNEYSLSLNYSNLKNSNTEDRMGGGAGIYFSARNDKRLNFLFGFEYNRTSQFKKNMYEGHFANSYNVTYSFNVVSIPIAFRYNFYLGKKIKLFVEPSLYLDLYLSAERKGTMETTMIYPNNQFEIVTKEFNENIDVSNVNYGPSLGLGLKFPISKHELIIKGDYKINLKKLASYIDDVNNQYFRLMLGFRI